MSRRVVITGIGAVSPIGLDEETIWSNIEAGTTGIDLITRIDTEEFNTKVGAEVDDDLLKEQLKAASIRTADRTTDMGILAVGKALESAGISTGDAESEPVPAALIFGSGIGSSEAMYNSFQAYHEKGVRGLRPTTIPRCMANAVSSQASIKYKLTGPNYVIVSACTSSTTAIGTAYRMIKDGYSSMAVCAGSDTVFDPAVFGGWNNMRVMSKNLNPDEACRPFAADRDGCVLGEGAGAMFIETLESARSRGAVIRGEIIGFGESSDAMHITGPDTGGQVRAIQACLDSAGITASDVDIINAHGTATHANDTCESTSIRAVFGDHTENVKVSSTKSFLGHMLGASGIMESIITVLALEKGSIPQNLNLDNPDPECNLSFVVDKPLKLDASIALKNSFGFGGNNGVIALKKWAD